MKVAWQFIAWNVPDGRYFEADHTVPYGTDLLLDASQAVNCLATITQSLRDQNKLPYPNEAGL